VSAAGQAESRALLDQVFGALSDPVRRGIVARLAHGPCSVTVLSEPYPISPPAISRHLSVLEQAGLIARWRAGRVHYCRLRAESLQVAAHWIEQHRTFWEGQLDALAAYLDEESTRWPTVEQPREGSYSISNAGSPSDRRGSSRPGRAPKR
jgi:DNA-binding transcriptional ArsR family regulator